MSPAPFEAMRGSGHKEIALPCPTDRIPEGLLLAAVKRAQLHQNRDEGVAIWQIKAHLGLRHNGWTTRKVRPLLVAAALLEHRWEQSRNLWAVTPKGRRRASSFSELPESPQHRAWREARVLAEQEAERLLTALRDAVGAATALLDNPRHRSRTWLAVGKRLEAACSRMASMTYCLYEWVEPDDSKADIARPGEWELRNTRLWKRLTCAIRRIVENVAVPPSTGPALIILVAFVLPGFVTVLIQEATFRRAEDPTTLDRLLRILYYSVWTYLLLALVALLAGVDRAYVEGFYEQSEGNPAELVWRAALLILIPSMIIATATRAWYGSKLQACVLKVARINEHHSEPTGWDFFFRQSRNAYVRVTFKDGGRVYGYYGGDSFSAYAKDGRDLFLERVHADVDDWFGPAAKNTCGIWVNTGDAISVEFYDAEHASSTTTEREAPGPETTEGNGSQASAETTGG